MLVQVPAGVKLVGDDVGVEVWLSPHSRRHVEGRLGHRGVTCAGRMYPTAH